ncbi:hypothetical protein [Massilia pseudoviolaceinigra]|uniref:hypothetical protein n=1 Tax=Massilia pseudoviolaceinigra TaxID=3057165 RepID=UPI002796ADEF|nr:hypothetical protein [Massilia sp. CCM 9206]MDQ1923147.1 hypothetical protein [Massilia sp. CCM 9206]
MSYILKVVVPPVPSDNLSVRGFANTLAHTSMDLPPSARLLQFYEAITARYPCASSGAYSRASAAACPWADTPLIDCLTGDIGVISLSYKNIEVLSFVLRRAGALSLTVIDTQAGLVYRPARFRVVLTSIQKNVNTAAMLGKLVPLLKCTPEQAASMLATPNAVLRSRLDHVTAQRLVATMHLLGCNCSVEKEPSRSAQKAAAKPAAAPGAPRVPAPRARAQARMPAPFAMAYKAVANRAVCFVQALLERLWERMTATRPYS